MWSVALALLGELPNEREVTMARTLATFAMRLGGLGLRSAERIAPAADWASWAGALSVLEAATTALAARADDNPQSATVEARLAGELLAREGFVIEKLSWDDLRNGIRPEKPVSRDPGEWAHGWQYHASPTREHHFRGSAVLTPALLSDRARTCARTLADTQVQSSSEPRRRPSS